MNALSLLSSWVHPKSNLCTLIFKVVCPAHSTNTPSGEQIDRRRTKNIFSATNAGGSDSLMFCQYYRYMTAGTYDMKATTAYVWKIMQPNSMNNCPGIYNDYEGNCFTLIPIGTDPSAVWSFYGSTICPGIAGKSTTRLAEFYTVSSLNMFMAHYYSAFKAFYVGGKRSQVSGEFEWFTTGQAINMPITNGPLPGDCLYYHRNDGLMTIDCNEALGSFITGPGAPGAACETF